MSLLCVDALALRNDLERLGKNETPRLVPGDFKPDPTTKAVPINSDVLIAASWAIAIAMPNTL